MFPHTFQSSIHFKRYYVFFSVNPQIAFSKKKMNELKLEIAGHNTIDITENGLKTNV